MSSASTRGVKEAVARGIARRYRSERAFRALGLCALLIGLGFLAFFFYTLIGNGYTALQQTRIRLDVELDPAVIDPETTRDPATFAISVPCGNAIPYKAAAPADTRYRAPEPSPPPRQTNRKRIIDRL